MKRDTSVTWQRVDPASVNLDGMRVAIVGGTGGIGRALARFMAKRGARVIVVGRTFRDADVPGIEFIEADLGLMRQAERVAEALPAESLDLVVFTTGIFAAPQRQETAEGIERDMATSYLNRFVILRGIAERLGTVRKGASGKPRVFVMGYPGAGQAGAPDDLNAEASYGAMQQHMNTVAGNEALVLDAAKRWPKLAVFGLNPGLIKSDIRNNFLGEGSLKSRVIEWLIGLFMPSADAYAERLVPLLVSPDLEAKSGAMFDAKGHAVLPSPGLDDARVQAFIAASDALAARAAP